MSENSKEILSQTDRQEPLKSGIARLKEEELEQITGGTGENQDADTDEAPSYQSIVSSAIPGKSYKIGSNNF